MISFCLLFASPHFLVFPSNFFLWCLSLDTYAYCMVVLCMVLLFYFSSIHTFLPLTIANSYVFRLLVFLVVVSVSLCFSSSSPFFYLMFLEFCVLPMFLLIVFLSKDFDKISAVMFMVVLNIFGSLPFFIFSIFFEHKFSISGCSSETMEFTGSNNIPLFFCFLAILLSKLPVMFLHFWLTKAHVASSGVCSMILASLMLKLGSVALLKFCLPMEQSGFYFYCVFVSFSITSVLLFSLLMIRFFDLKNLVACSSIIHMALIFPFCLFLLSMMNFSSVMMMLGHGLSSVFMFFLVTLYYEITLNRSVDFNKSSESMSKSSTLMFFICFCLNFGVPPFVNFVSEMFCCCSIIFTTLSLSSFFVLSLLTFTIFFMFVITKMLFGKKNFLVTQPQDSQSFFILPLCGLSLILPLSA